MSRVKWSNEEENNLISITGDSNTKLKEFIEKFNINNRTETAVKSRIKKLEKENRIQLPQTDKKVTNGKGIINNKFKKTPTVRTSKKPTTAQQLSDLSARIQMLEIYVTELQKKLGMLNPTIEPKTVDINKNMLNI